MQEREQEKQRLAMTIQEFESLIGKNKEDIDHIYKTYSNDDWIVLEAKMDKKRTLANLVLNSKKPYFARIDFTEKNKEKEEFYIGKVGILNKDHKSIVTDWRSPIASVYYDGSVGPVSYEAPAGMIEGELSRKRQYEIENQELLGYRDVDTVSDDEILKPYLNASADHRLKNIVASIQVEQNKIIRDSMNRNMIVQGVAGSGKTTVALHRVAYLVYNHQEINSRDFMIIGPNAFFVSYISSVLPDLDVYDVSQNSMVELSMKYIKQKLHIKEEMTAYAPYKTSMECKRDIDAFLEKREKELLEQKNFCAKELQILSSEVLWKEYTELHPRKYVSTSSKIEKMILIFTKYIKNHENAIIMNLQDIFHQKMKVEEDREVILRERDIFKKLENNASKGFRTELRKHFGVLLEKPLSLYSKFLVQKKHISIEEYQNIRKGKIYPEDIPALMYFRYKMYGSGYYENYKHIVVDEAQDYNDFHFFVMKKIFSKATFSIFGDIAQSLYPLRSIDTWDSVLTSVLPENTNMIYLTKSYRTTIEIMNEANKINKHLSLSEAVPVIRHGKEVVYQTVEEYIPVIYELLLKFKNNYKTVAIIHKDIEPLKEVYKKLKKRGIDISFIDGNSDDYKGGICAVTSTLAKGLEFDAVIIFEVEDQIFQPSNSLDMKLLYVSMTRALHELHILYKKDKCSVLQ